MNPRTSRALIGAFWSAFAVPSLFACKQVLGLDAPPDAKPAPAAGEAGASGDAGSDASPGACGPPHGTKACASCAGASCCSEATACAASTPCNAYETCLGACPQGDFACRAQCQIDHPAGAAPEVSALSACMVAHCENECGLECGALAGWAVEPDAAAPFQACMVSNGCAQVRACAASADCDAVTRCFAICPIGNCLDSCIESHGVDPIWFWAPADAGESTATSTYAAFAQARTECGAVANNYWECVGHLSPPRVEASSTMLEVEVADSVTMLPVSLMEVRACAYDPGDFSCNAPIYAGHTDGSGRVTLQVPLSLGAIDYSATAWLRVTSPDTAANPTVPLDMFWTWPLTHSRAVLSYGRYVGLNYSSLGVSTRAGLQALIAAGQDAGIPQDPKRGWVHLVVVDCLGVWASGVQVTLSNADANTITLNLDLMRADPITDSTGQLIVLNLPAGPVTITATPLSVGRASGKAPVYVRASEATFVVIRPTPM
jgi:hypothetical protein